MPSSARRKFDTLDAGRGVAAIAVALHHASQWRIYSDVSFARILQGNALGVAYFFVLSGTVIVLAHWRHIGETSYCVTFLRKRARRIYPLYWVAVITWLLIAMRGSFPGWALLDGAALVRFIPNDYVFFAPSWTLYYEVSFYVVFLSLIFHKRFGMVVLGVWWLAAALSFRCSPLDFSAYPSSIHLLFGVGAFAGWLLVTGRRILAPRLLMYAGVGLLSFIVMLSAWLPLQQWTYLAAGGASLLIILGAAELERRERLNVPAIFTFFGSASYALYLFHPMFQFITTALLRRAKHHVALPDLACLVILFAVSVAGGYAAHVWLEKPMMRWINRPRQTA